MTAGSLNLSKVVEAQTHMWYLVPHFPMFIVFFISVIAETNRHPFDLPEAESELVAGFHTEYSGFRFSLFFLAEYANMITSSAMMVTLFFGGWTLPFAGLDQPASTIAGGLLHIGIFLGKVIVLMVLFIWVRWMLPRFRYDQLMDLGWRRFLPVALANIVVTAVVLLIFNSK